MKSMDDHESEDEERQRPRFKGCIFCYSAEMAKYGIDKLSVRSADA